jgi:hypothetical protein
VCCYVIHHSIYYCALNEALMTLRAVVLDAIWRDIPRASRRTLVC